LLSRLIAAPVNRLLRGESWALRRLQPFAGRTASFDAFPFRFSFSVTPEGEVRAAEPVVQADVSFRLTPLVGMRVLAGDEAARREVQVTGDTEFAQAIELVASNLRWDAEEDLARIFGDVAAHRIATTGRDLFAWQVRTIDRAARSLGEFLTEERPVIARRDDVARFVTEVDTLRDDVERLEQRIERLARRTAG